MTTAAAATPGPDNDRLGSRACLTTAPSQFHGGRGGGGGGRRAGTRGILKKAKFLPYLANHRPGIEHSSGKDTFIPKDKGPQEGLAWKLAF
jgi:hypothetical protein